MAAAGKPKTLARLDWTERGGAPEMVRRTVFFCSFVQLRWIFLVGFAFNHVGCFLRLEAVCMGWLCCAFAHFIRSRLLSFRLTCVLVPLLSSGLLIA